MLNTLFGLVLQEGSWIIRIDTPHVPGAKRHIHLQKKRLRGSYSWNEDGTRHDGHNFPRNNAAIEAAKRIASKHLGVPRSQLSLITEFPAVRDVQITVGDDSFDHGPTEVIVVSRIPKAAKLLLLGGRAGRVYLLIH